MEDGSRFNIENVIDHLNQNRDNSPFPMCGSINRIVTDKVYEFREFNEGNEALKNCSIFPVVPVSCNECGNSIMINALISGAIKRQNDKPDESGENDIKE